MFKSSFRAKLQCLVQKQGLCGDTFLKRKHFTSHDSKRPALTGAKTLVNNHTCGAADTASSYSRQCHHFVDATQANIRGLSLLLSGSLRNTSASSGLGAS